MTTVVAVLTSRDHEREVRRQRWTTLPSFEEVADE
jgi:hypothetical protein